MINSAHDVTPIYPFMHIFYFLYFEDGFEWKCMKGDIDISHFAPPFLPLSTFECTELTLGTVLVGAGSHSLSNSVTDSHGMG